MLRFPASFSLPDHVVVKSSSCPCHACAIKKERRTAWCKNFDNVCPNLVVISEAKGYVICKGEIRIAEVPAKEKKWFEKLPDPAAKKGFNWSAFFTFLAPSLISKVLKQKSVPSGDEEEIAPEVKALIFRFLKSKHKVFHYNTLLRFFELGNRNYVWIRRDGSVELYNAATKITIINRNISSLPSDLERFYKTLVF